MRELAIAAAVLVTLACDAGPDVSMDSLSAAIRLIHEEPQETLSSTASGVETSVLDSSFGTDAWWPTGTADTWRLEEDSLVIGPGAWPLDLERELSLDASALHSLEVTLASDYRVRLALFWTSERAVEASDGASHWIEQPLTLTYSEGQGEPHRKTFTFDLRSHFRWSGAIRRLRLRLEPARSSERITVLRVRGLRQDLSPEALAEQSLRSWKVELDREVQDALVVPPGHPVEREVLVPAAAALRFAVGATGRLATPIDFRLVAERPTGEVLTLFETRVEPLTVGESRRWRPVVVDLEALAGERIRLRAESHAGDDYDPALGFPAWANPEIVGAAQEGRPNIVLVSVDTLRADRLSLYGHGRLTSPRIDAWARRHAIVFRQAVAPAPWTLPSHASMLTGVDALRHGVNHPFRAAPESLTTLAERLRDEGYFTAAINGGAWLHPHYGLAQGFSRYRTWSGEQRGDRELEAHAALATRWLEELREPFFLFLHTFDVHDFNAPHRRAASGSELTADELYDRAVSHMDDQMGGFLEAASEPRNGRTLVALTSDHGEDLGEDGISGHGSLREQVLRVPLVIGSTGGLGAGKMVDEQVRSVDLVPTLLDLAGFEVPSGLDGVSLRGLIEGGLIEGEIMTVPSVATSYFALDHGVSLRVQNRWKYLYDASAWTPGEQGQGSGPREALFQLPGSETSSDDLAPGHPLVERLRAQARQLLRERLAGLRLTVDNALPLPFVATLRGDLIRSGVPKSIDSSASLVRVGETGAAFSVSPSERLQLLFERVGEPRFELEVTPLDGEVQAEGRRLAIDLGALGLPIAFRWTGSEWHNAAAASVPVVTVTVEWHGATELGGAAPFEENPELRRQLETLGYLE